MRLCSNENVSTNTQPLETHLIFNNPPSSQEFINFQKLVLFIGLQGYYPLFLNEIPLLQVYISLISSHKWTPRKQKYKLLLGVEYLGSLCDSSLGLGLVCKVRTQDLEKFDEEVKSLVTACCLCSSSTCKRFSLETSIILQVNPGSKKLLSGLLLKRQK